eukprot:TRINITY_DN28618_c3_g1_i1.p1 TRINITY_DN28618_c3_g1~~TRINITY_DN28618_c3_g1_i1.p1  ORF type:complete len:108 (-),score=10.40 TRINITY_DN28618_c3_g1_i1:35-358(-)
MLNSSALMIKFPFHLMTLFAIIVAWQKEKLHLIPIRDTNSKACFHLVNNDVWGPTVLSRDGYKYSLSDEFLHYRSPNKKDGYKYLSHDLPIYDPSEPSTHMGPPELY